MFLKYSDFLSEKIDMSQVAWFKKSSYFAARGYLPFTPKIAKELYNNRVNCFHITGLRELKRFKHLIGRKKSISAFTKMGEDELQQSWGIQTSFDIIFHIDGNLVIRSNYDLMSQPDDSGRRWISVSDLSFQSEDFRIAHLNLLKEADKKFGKDFIMNLINPNNTSIDNKQKAAFIAWWISEAEKLIIQYKEDILLGLSTGSTGNWDELLVNDIKIKDAVLILDKDSEDSDYFNERVKTSYGSLESLEKLLKSLTQGEVWITSDRKDVLNFVKKRGGTIL